MSIKVLVVIDMFVLSISLKIILVKKLTFYL